MSAPVKKILYTGLVINIVLTVIKLTFGLLGNSFSLTVDGINSFIDILISSLLLISLKVASKEPDNDHPYGHEKYEVVVSLILGIFLILTSIIIVTTSVSSFSNDTNIEPFTLIVSFVSLTLKGIIFSVNLFGYKKYQQISLKADAYNHFGDILATASSFLGILISIYTRFKYFDYVAAIIISVIIFVNGINVIKDSIKLLVDESPSKSFNKKVQSYIKSLPGVIKIDDYKSRLHVNKVYIDLEISVDKELSLIAAHEIAEFVHLNVEKAFPEVIHCMVHVNPNLK